MQKVAVLLACLACTGYGKEVKKTLNPAAPLAKLLLANSGGAAFNAPGQASLASSPRSQVSMAASRSLPWMESPAHLEGMIGNAGFDPLGISTPENIRWMREAELKHGRMCMLAWLGYVAVDCGIKFPGERYEVLTSFNAHDATVEKELFLLLLWVGTFETIGFTQIMDMQLDPYHPRQPGDFGFDPMGIITPENEEWYKTAELTHARLAMLAFSAVVTQSAIGYPKFPYF